MSAGTTALTADAVVVGSGVIGSAVALELARGGRRVLVLDKAAGAGHGSTSASSAVVRFLYSSFETVATAWEAKFCWERWAEHLDLPEGDDTALCRFHRTGMLHLDVPAVPREETAALLRAAGVPFERLEAAELAQRFGGHVDSGAYWPNKPVTDEAFWEETDARLGALYTPDAGYVDDPRLAADNLATAARAHGARTLFRAEVVACERVGETWRTTLADGRPGAGCVDDDRALDAAAVGVRPLRQEVHQVSQPAGYGTDAAPGPGVFDLDLGTYMRPGPAGAWVVGGTEPECDGFEWIEDPDDVHGDAPRSGRVTAERYEAQVMRAARRLPELRVPNRPSGVVGVYDVSDDWTAIYDRTDAPGFYVAIGTSGNSFKNAPASGQIMAAIVEAVEDGVDHDADPVTWVAPHTGLKIDLSAYSRKRPVHAASTRTVLG